MLEEREQREQRKRMRSAERAAAETGTDPAIVASAASVLLALHYFFLRGRREMGIFVGLWAPTILAFSSYFKQSEMSDDLKRASGRKGLMRSIDEMMNRR